MHLCVAHRCMAMPGCPSWAFMLLAVARQAAWRCGDYQGSNYSREVDPLYTTLQRCKALTHLALLKRSAVHSKGAPYYDYEVLPDKLHGALAECVSQTLLR